MSLEYLLGIIHIIIFFSKTFLLFCRIYFSLWPEKLNILKKNILLHIMLKRIFTIKMKIVKKRRSNIFSEKYVENLKQECIKRHTFSMYIE